jgi:NAD+ synthase (glutamine-hydrolysing)
MSHYAVNVSVPKTLVAHVIRWVAGSAAFGEDTSVLLHSVLDTVISPELVPGQQTESAIGPFELHDFYLYYTLRFGYSPPKVAFLCYCAWHEADRGLWPDIPIEKRRHYEIGQIKFYLQIFVTRFFKLSQFKRSCIPNGPKVGSGGSLSPRGDYRAPSDSEATAWLEQIKWIPDEKA